MASTPTGHNVHFQKMALVPDMSMGQEMVHRGKPSPPRWTQCRYTAAAKASTHQRFPTSSLVSEGKTHRLTFAI